MGLRGRVRVCACLGLVAALLVGLAPPASAGASSGAAGWAQAERRDDVPHLLESSKWSRGGGGGSGVFETGAGFWYVTEPNYRAVWNFGYLQGMYRPVFYVPGSEGWFPADPLASGRAVYVMQVRRDGGGWETVEFFTINQGPLAAWASSWWYPTRLGDGVALDGVTRVLVHMEPNGSGIVVADSFRLTRQGPLPADPPSLPTYPHDERCQPDQDDE